MIKQFPLLPRPKYIPGWSLPQEWLVVKVSDGKTGYANISELGLDKA